MTSTIFLLLLVFAGIIIFALYKFIIPSDNTTKSIEEYEYENKIQKESAYSYHIGDIDKTISITLRTIEQNPHDVVSKFILGKLYLEKKQYEKALKLFEDLKKKNPKHLPTREKLVECYIGINNFVKAEDELNYIINFKPNDINILNTLAFIYEKHKDTLGAMNVLKRILEKEPDNTRAREKLARICEVRGEFTRSIQEYEILYSNDPIIDYARKLSELYYKAERYQKSINMLEQILSTNKNDPKIIKQLAFLYWDLEDYDNALIYFEQLMPISTEEENLINDYIAQIYLHYQEYDKVIEFCDEYLQKNPASEAAKFNLSKSYLGKQEFQIAIDIVKDLLTETALDNNEKKLRDYLSNILGQWAVHFFQQGNYQDAFEKFMTALQYNERNSEIYYNLAKTNQKIRNYEEALSQFKRAISLSPERAEYYLELGRLYKDMGNYKPAIPVLEKAIEIKHGDFVAYFELGLVYMLQDIYESAIVLFKKSIELDPYFNEARYNLALSYEKNGETNKAIKEYENVLEQNPEHIEAKNNLNILIEAE